MTTSPSRPVSLVLVAATALGLWFGLAAPDTSPVLPQPGGPVPVAVPVVQDDGPRDGGRR